MLHVVIYAVIVPLLLILLFLAQLYLSTRKGRVWGLVLPVVFLLIFLLAVGGGALGASLIPNKTAVTFFAVLGGVGTVCYFVEYLFGRQLRRTKLARKEEARLSRRISHKQRLLDKAIARGDGEARDALTEELALLAAEHDAALAKVKAEEKRLFSPKAKKAKQDKEKRSPRKEKKPFRSREKDAAAALPAEQELEWEYDLPETEQAAEIPAEPAAEIPAEPAAEAAEAAAEIVDTAAEENVDMTDTATETAEEAADIPAETEPAATEGAAEPALAVKAKRASAVKSARKKNGKKR